MEAAVPNPALPDPGLMSRLRTSADDLAWAAGLLAEWPRQPVEEIWSAHHQLAHLVAVERDNYHVRIARMLAEQEPKLVSWDSAAFDAGYSEDGELATLIAEFAQERGKTVQMFDRLAPEQWARSAIWPDGTRINLAWLAEKALWHALDHMQQTLDLHQEFTAGGGNVDVHDNVHFAHEAVLDSRSAEKSPCTRR